MGVANIAAGIQGLARVATQNHHSGPKFMEWLLTANVEGIAVLFAQVR